MVDPPPATGPRAEAIWDRSRPLLVKWLERARTNQLQHYKAADYYSRANNLLGIPAAILSAVVGTAVFSTLEKKVGLRIELIVGSLSVLTAILAALQTFLRYAERAEKHRSVAASYGAMRKQIEEIGYLPVNQRGGLKEFLDGLRAQADSLAQGAPSPPPSIWAALRKAKGENFFVPEWPSHDPIVDAVFIEQDIGPASMLGSIFVGHDTGSAGGAAPAAQGTAPSHAREPYPEP